MSNGRKSRFNDSREGLSRSGRARFFYKNNQTKKQGIHFSNIRIANDRRKKRKFIMVFSMFLMSIGLLCVITVLSFKEPVMDCSSEQACLESAGRVVQ